MTLRRFMGKNGTTHSTAGRNGAAVESMSSFSRDGVTIQFGNASDFYASWPSPVCIIADGPYGIGGFPGDPPTADSLADWYRPHVEAWAKFSTPVTTLWFWNTELGWANVHPVLVANGWEYRCCHVWDKGLSHIAGNANSQTLRKFPVVSEVCVQYVKPAVFLIDGKKATMREWLRHEWLRSGLPLNKTNEACGVKNAATRKYFTQDHLWYYPPVAAFQQFVKYANRHGRVTGRPYFSIDGVKPLSGDEWAVMRSKFTCEHGITNVWQEPPVRGVERLKAKHGCLHNNQKPLRLIDICIRASTDPGDVVWEPFGGLCSAAVVSHSSQRRCVSAEILPEYYRASVERLKTHGTSLFSNTRPIAAPEAMAV